MRRLRRLVIAAALAAGGCCGPAPKDRVEITVDGIPEGTRHILVMARTAEGLQALKESSCYMGWYENTPNGNLSEKPLPTALTLPVIWRDATVYAVLVRDEHRRWHAAWFEAATVPRENRGLFGIGGTAAFHLTGREAWEAVGDETLRPLGITDGLATIDWERPPFHWSADHPDRWSQIYLARELDEFLDHALAQAEKQEFAKATEAADRLMDYLAYLEGDTDEWTPGEKAALEAIARQFRPFDDAATAKDLPALRQIVAGMRASVAEFCPLRRPK